MSELSGNDEQRWCSNREALQALDFPEEEAEKLLRRAFGWTTQKYWRGTKVREVPAPGQVKAVLQFLDGIGVHGPEASKVITAFPELAACSVDKMLKANVAKLERDWKIKGAKAVTVIKQRPQVLGYEVDCKGNCISKCTRCWEQW